MSQLSLPLLPIDDPSVFELVFELDDNLRQVICNPQDWPTKTLCIIGEKMGSVDAIPKSWNMGEVIFVQKSNLNEAKLLESLVAGEMGKRHVLICANESISSWSITSADLKSRLDNITCLNAISCNKSILKHVLGNWARRYGIKVMEKHVTQMVDELNLDFVIISQLICYIKSEYQYCETLDANAIASIIKGFEQSLMGNGLFNRD